MIRFAFILSALLLTAAAPASDLEKFFETDLDCGDRLDELLFLGQAAERGVAVQEETFDGGSLRGFTRAYVRGEENLLRATYHFATLVGWKRRLEQSSLNLEEAVGALRVTGRTFVAQKGVHAIKGRKAHVRDIPVYVLSTNQVVEADAKALDEFLTEFHRPPRADK